MRRDLQLVYLILLELEDKPFVEVIQFKGDKIPFEYKDISEKKMTYHLQILKDEGFLALDYPSLAYYITWKGYALVTEMKNTRQLDDNLR